MESKNSEQQHETNRWKCVC